MIRTYSELIRLASFEERFKYLKLDGVVGEDTYGWERYLNQSFYKSKEWKNIRDYVITRDCGLDLGLLDISGRIIIHHMNPISANDIREATDILLKPEYLITTSDRTHNAIHYGNLDMLVTEFVTRTKNDTCPWKR